MHKLYKKCVYKIVTEFDPEKCKEKTLQWILDNYSQHRKEAFKRRYLFHYKCGHETMNEEHIENLYCEKCKLRVDQEEAVNQEEVKEAKNGME